MESKIIPVNGHLLISPLKHESLLPTEKGQYDEVGEVVAIAGDAMNYMGIEIHDIVFYDSWLASKYPTGKDDEVFWLVPYKDIRAIQKKEKDEKRQSSEDAI